MKKIFTIALAVLFISCEQNTEELNQLRAERNMLKTMCKCILVSGKEYFLKEILIL